MTSSMDDAEHHRFIDLTMSRDGRGSWLQIACTGVVVRLANGRCQRVPARGERTGGSVRTCRTVCHSS